MGEYMPCEYLSKNGISQAFIQCQNVSAQAMNCNCKSSNILHLRWTMLAFCMVFNKSKNNAFLKQFWLFLKLILLKHWSRSFYSILPKYIWYFNCHRHLNTLFWASSTNLFKLFCILDQFCSFTVTEAPGSCESKLGKPCLL